MVHPNAVVARRETTCRAMGQHMIVVMESFGCRSLSGRHDAFALRSKLSIVLISCHEVGHVVQLRAHELWRLYTFAIK